MDKESREEGYDTVRERREDESGREGKERQSL